MLGFLTKYNTGNLAATIVGGLFGGALVMRYGVLRALMFAGILQLLSNFVFALQALAGHDVAMLIITIGTENITGGMATAAFVAYLSSLCSAEFTATQYALLSSLMAFARDVISSTSGALAERVDWVVFFVATAGLALPGLLVLAWIIRRELGRVTMPAREG